MKKNKLPKWNLDEIYAAQNDAGGEAGNVADNAAAQRDKGRVSSRRAVQDGLHDVLDCRKRLAGFAGREGYRFGRKSRTR